MINLPPPLVNIIGGGLRQSQGLHLLQAYAYRVTHRIESPTFLGVGAQAHMVEFM
jgi:hypothetical protein